MPTFDPRPCKRCKKPFTPKGPAGRYCADCNPRPGRKDKPRTGGGTRRKAPRLEPAMHDAVGAKASAKATATQLLGQLRTIRTRLDERIAAVEDLCSIL